MILSQQIISLHLVQLNCKGTASVGINMRMPFFLLSLPPEKKAPRKKLINSWIRHNSSLSCRREWINFVPSTKFLWRDAFFPLLFACVRLRNLFAHIFFCFLFQLQTVEIYVALPVCFIEFLSIK